MNKTEEIATSQWLTGNGELTVPPLVTDSSDSPRTDAAPTATAVPRILLVEDNADARLYLQRLLKPHYEVTAVADGQAALDAFYQQPPDLVLSDIVMPGFDGMQLLKILKSHQHTARVPVMLMSGEAGEDIRISAYQAGAVDYLLKPFSAKELLVRVQAQLQLAPIQPEDERQLISLFAQAPIAIAVLRGPQFEVELATPAMCGICNRSLHQLLGRPVFEVLTEAAGQGFEELLTGVLQTGTPFEGHELPVTLIRDGKPQPVLVNFIYQPLYDQSDSLVSGIVVVATDVTESVRARQVVEGNAHRLQTLFEQAPVGVVVLGPGPDIPFELVNPFYCELVGRTADQLIGKPLLAALPELAGQGFETLLMEVMITGTPYLSGETAVRLVRNGRLETIYVNFVYQPRYGADQTITGVVVIVTDITQAVRARQRVEADERLLNAMIRQTPLGVAIFRRPDSVIERANPTVCQIWDRTPKQVVGKPLFEVLPEAAGQGFEELLASVYETGIPFEGKELPATIERNGQLETVYFDFVYEPLPEADGSIERIMVVATDATKAREARRLLEESERRYRQLTTELEERVKERTLDLERSNLDLMQFASVASHDLKEPLRKVQIFGTRLEGMLAGRLNEEEADLFRRLVGATARMQALVGDVLRLSILSNQTIGFEPVVLNTTIDRIRDDLEVVIHERGAELTTESLPTVLAAQGQMHQLFQNLISNALKFNTNPVPAVRVEPVPLTDTVADELGLPTRDYDVIAVSDNGIGFNAKDKDKIFDMFQRLNGRSQYAGTGIGLTIVRKIVENHRGFIDVRSEPGRGTTFRVALPVK